MAKRKTAPKKKMPTERLTRSQFQKYRATFSKAMIKAFYSKRKMKRYFYRLKEIMLAMVKSRQIPEYKWKKSAFQLLHAVCLAEDNVTAIFGDDLMAGIERKVVAKLPVIGGISMIIGTLPSSDL